MLAGADSTRTHSVLIVRRENHSLRKLTLYSKMAPSSRESVAYEPLNMELHELNYLHHPVASTLNSSGAPSFAATSTEGIHDNEVERPLFNHGLSQGDRRDKCADIDDHATNPAWKRCYRFKSWKISVSTACLMTIAVLLTNCTLTIWASLYFGIEGSTGIGTAYNGDCATVSRLSLWLHVLINILSSFLLSASNYAMQCATAPTRPECDDAHMRGDSLDVGVLSVRNLARIGWQRRIIWTLLALSSTPIHLLYNSAVFKTTDNNDYSAVISGSNFLDIRFNVTAADKLSSEMHNTYLADPSSWVKLPPRECIEVYITYAISGRSDVIGILKNHSDMGARAVNKDMTEAKLNLPYDW